MDPIHFQGEVGTDNVIRVPEGIKLPPGPIEVTVAPCASRSQPADRELVKREDYATVWDWLAAVGRQAETWDTNLPSDMAANHDHYAHGKPRE
jgi:hypothetical protein